jgi:hypothetical protein
MLFFFLFTDLGNFSIGYYSNSNHQMASTGGEGSCTFRRERHSVIPTLKLKNLPLRERSLEARPSLQAPLEKKRGAACLVEEGELGVSL